jgi:hypothetical protein
VHWQSMQRPFTTVKTRYSLIAKYVCQVFGLHPTACSQYVLVLLGDSYKSPVSLVIFAGAFGVLFGDVVGLRLVGTRHL